jgi:hypothetical protein
MTDRHHRAAPPLPDADVIFTDLDGVEGVLVDLRTKRYVRLNETASFIWQRLAQGLTAADVASELTRTYDVTPERAASSVNAAIETFRVHRLLRRTSGAAS